MFNIAFVTDNKYPNLTSDDRLLIRPLRKLGFAVIPAVWNDDSVIWTDFKAVVFRSCWTYYLKINEFKLWLDNLAKNNIKTWNPVKVIKWNIDKTYLMRLGKMGIDSIPTFESIKDIDLAAAEYIIKPRFGTDSYNIHKINSKDLLDLPKDTLIQPFIPEVSQKGELSMVFINNSFSHAIRKIPPRGEFRTGDMFKPKWIKTEISQEYKDKGTEIIKNLNQDLLYARVDVVEVDGKLLVMEIELTEPFLYLGWHKPALEAFANSLVSKIS